MVVTSVNKLFFEMDRREQGTGNREQRTENREQRTENREQRTENREQGTGKDNFLRKFAE